MAKPAKLVKTANLSSPAGAREIDFGKSNADNRMRGDHSKAGSRSGPVLEEFDDHKARMKRYSKVVG